MREEHFAILRRHMVEVIGIYVDLGGDELGKRARDERVLAAHGPGAPSCRRPGAARAASPPGHPVADRLRQDDLDPSWLPSCSICWSRGRATWCSRSAPA